MLALSRRTVIATSMAAAIGIAVPATLAATSGGAQPADKAVAAGSTLQVVDANQTQPILTTTIKTSKPEDLLMTVSLECSILTKLVTNNNNPSADQQASVRIWIDIDGKTVPVTDASAPPQDPSQTGNGNPAVDGVNFCAREYQRTVTNGETAPDGIDTQSDYIATKSAHAFSWVRLNTGSGTHSIQVFAKFFATAQDSAGSNAQAYVGNRTLVVDPTKMANNAVISDTSTP